MRAFSGGDGMTADRDRGYCQAFREAIDTCEAAAEYQRARGDRRGAVLLLALAVVLCERARETPDPDEITPLELPPRN